MSNTGDRKHHLYTYAVDLSRQNLLEKTTADVSQESVGPLVEALSFDSRDCKPGTLFICKGRAFKPEYLEKAIALGAVAYVAEQAYEQAGVPGLIVKDIRLAMVFLARRMYNDPQNELTLIGITGTKGKSTTVRMMQQVLNSWLISCDKPPTGVISSITYFDGVRESEAVLTTPEIPDLYRMLRTGVEAGLTHFIIEVSSQALKYNRLDGLRFSTAAFLNISEDHISPVEHPDFTDYLEAKLRLFERCDQIVYSLDTDYTARLQSASSHLPALSFSAANPDADIYCNKIQANAQGLDLSIVQKGGPAVDMRVNMPGRFNAENALATFAMAEQLDIPIEHIKEGLRLARAEGRMEILESDSEPIAIIVDFAHNTLSWNRLADTAEELFPEREIIYIGGVAGGKALNRRRDLGEFLGAGRITKAYLTASNPGNERTEDICDEIIRYIAPATLPYEVIPDRDAAIDRAVTAIEKPTVVLLAGQGSHTRMWVGRELVDRPSDMEAAKHALALRAKHKENKQ